MPLPPISATLGLVGGKADLVARQQDRHLGALAEFALDLHRPSGLVRKAVDLRQPKPGALADGFRREEGIEDLAEHVGRDALAGVLDADGHEVGDIGLIGGGIAGGDRDRAAERHGIARIDDEIDHRGFELGDVDRHRPEPVFEIEHEPDRAADAGLQHFADRLDPIRYADRLRIDALPPGEGQELAGQRGAALGRGLDRGDRALHLGIAGRALFQEMQAAADHHQDVVEVMRDAAGELAERVELLRFGQMLLHLLELELRRRGAR